MSDQQPSTENRSQNRRRDLRRTLLITAALVVLFFTVPLARRDDTEWWLVLLAVGALVLFLGMSIRLILHGANLFRLLNLVLIVILGFTLGFYAMAQNMPGQFDGLDTRVDSLYFTLTTMTTTGYGDIHASGQLARAVVSLAFMFDALFLWLLGAELHRMADERSQRRHSKS